MTWRQGAKIEALARPHHSGRVIGVVGPEIPQAAKVYVNALMVQNVLVFDEWSLLLTSGDRRGLNSLI